MKKVFLLLFTVVFTVLKLSAQWVQSGTSVYWNNTGNVGAGGITTGMAGKLHVGDNTLAGIVLDNRLTSVTAKIPAQIIWSESSAPANYLAGDLLILPRTSGAAGTVRFLTGLTPAERLTIDASGNVSVGTVANTASTAPTEKFQVYGGNIRITSAAALNTTIGALKISTATYPAAYAGLAGITNSGGVDQLDLAFYSAFGTASEKMRIMSNTGYVGIGTSAPAARVDIVGAGGSNVDLQTTGRVRIKSTSPGIWFNDLNGDKAELGTMGSGNPNQALGVYTNTGGWNSFNVMVDGSVAIGSQATNANAKLDVTGNIYCNSKIYIGTADASTTAQMASYALGVNGTAIFNKAKVKLYGNWPDYVFDDKYKLMPLAEVEKFLKQNKHLPEVPTAAETEKDGIDLGDNQSILLKKVEELTLYIIGQSKNIEAQQKEINDLKNQIFLLQKK